MTEALALMMAHCFGTMRLHRLEAACLDENAPSQRLLRPAGFRPEGTLREYLKIDGVRRDHQLHARLVTAGPVPGLAAPRYAFPRSERQRRGREGGITLRL